MPYRRALAATWRGPCKLSRTILSFSPSAQRRRRPVSTTSSRSTWALRLSLSIRTVLNNTPHSARRPSPDGYAVSPSCRFAAFHGLKLGCWLQGDVGTRLLLWAACRNLFYLCLIARNPPFVAH